MLTRDPALDTRTPRARRSVHPHSDTTPRYTRTLLPDTPCENPRTLHSGTRAPLHSDTTSGYTRAPNSYACPVRAKTSLLHGPCSRLVFTEGRTYYQFMVRAPDPRLPLVTSTVLLLPYELLFTSRSSNTVSLRSRSIPSATA